MLKIGNAFKYHECGELTIVVMSGYVLLTIGTPATGFKTGDDGFNHDDLGLGALVNFMCWPPQRLVTLNAGDEFTIKSFVAYNIKAFGVYSIKGFYDGEIKFYM